MSKSDPPAKETPASSIKPSEEIRRKSSIKDAATSMNPRSPLDRKASIKEPDTTIPASNSTKLKESTERRASVKDIRPITPKESHASSSIKRPESIERRPSVKDSDHKPVSETPSTKSSKFGEKRISLKEIEFPVSDDDALILKGEEIPLTPLSTSFGLFMFERLNLHKDKILQVDANTGEDVRGMELHARAICVAMELRSHLGEQVYEDSKIVAAVLDNGTSASYALVGTLYAGATFAPVNPDLGEDDLKHVMMLLSPDFVFCTPRALNNVKAALISKCEILETCHGCKMWDEIINRPRHMDLRKFRPPSNTVNLDGPALIMCSSGTTGPPKGVMFSHRTVHRFILLREFLSRSRPAGSGAETTLVANPFAWVSGLIPTLSSCASGWLLLQFARFDVDRVLGAVQEHRVTAVTLATPLVAAIASDPRASNYDASAVALFRFGGSPLNRELRKRAEEKIKKKLTYHYGLTECPWPVTSGAKSEEKPNTVGVVAANTWIKIADFKTGRALGPNHEGEICIKSKLMFTGYYKDDRATGEALDPQGWLHTGDVGHYDSEGYIFMTDRFKELIKCKGFHISPKEIEDVIMKHDAVQDVAVVGVYDDDDNEEYPAAFVVVKPGHFVSSEELVEMVKDELPDYKQLQGGIYFGNQIPKSQGGKIRRRELRVMADQHDFKKKMKRNRRKKDLPTHK